MLADYLENNRDSDQAWLDTNPDEIDIEQLRDLFGEPAPQVKVLAEDPSHMNALRMENQRLKKIIDQDGGLQE